ELLRDLGPLIKGLAIGLKNIATSGAAESFGELTKNLGKILPVLGDLIGLLSRTNITGTIVRALAILADALAPVIPDLQRLADAIGDLLAAGLQALAPLISALGSALGPLARSLTPIVVLLADLIDAAAPLIGLLSSLAPLIITVAVAFETLKIIQSAQ